MFPDMGMYGIAVTVHNLWWEGTNTQQPPACSPHHTVWLAPPPYSFRPFVIGLWIQPQDLSQHSACGPWDKPLREWFPWSEQDTPQAQNLPLFHVGEHISVHTGRLPSHPSASDNQLPFFTSLPFKQGCLIMSWKWPGWGCVCSALSDPEQAFHHTYQHHAPGWIWRGHGNKWYLKGDSAWIGYFCHLSSYFLNKGSPTPGKLHGFRF